MWYIGVAYGKHNQSSSKSYPNPVKKVVYVFFHNYLISIDSTKVDLSVNVLSKMASIF